MEYLFAPLQLVPLAVCLRILGVMAIIDLPGDKRDEEGTRDGTQLCAGNLIPLLERGNNFEMRFA